MALESGNKGSGQVSFQSYLIVLSEVNVKCWSAECMSVSEQVGFLYFVVVFAFWGQVALVRRHQQRVH